MSNHYSTVSAGSLRFLQMVAKWRGGGTWWLGNSLSGGGKIEVMVCYIFKQ